MRVTIVPSDNFMQIDGRTIWIDLSDIPTNIHAVQWDGVSGHVEYTNSQNVVLQNLSAFQTWIDRWTAARDIEDAPPPPKTPEQLAAEARGAAKKAREATVAAIKVTTQAGNTFDGDETSQNRMARAIIALNAQPQDPAPTVTWVLADNTPIQVTAAELTEALALAGAAQAAIWVI